MAHFAKPFYRAPRRVWMVEIHRKQIALGKHPENLPEPVKGKKGWNPPDEIWQEYHKKMAEHVEPPKAQAPASQHPFVATILDDFIGWLKNRVIEGSKAERTLTWYETYLMSFLDYLRSLEGNPEVPLLTVDQLEPEHVYGWVDSKPGWKTGKRGAMTALQRAFNWAAKAKKLKTIGNRSPISSLEKPAQGRREQIISPKEYKEILAHIQDQDFRDLVEAAWETGARPQELFAVESAYVDVANARWVFPLHQSKGKKCQRVVYLTEKALAITVRRMQAFPHGPIFQTTEGTRWCVSSTKCRFQRLRLAMGRSRTAAEGLAPPEIPKLTSYERRIPEARTARSKAVRERRKAIKELAWKHGTRYSLYSFRHSWCTRALTEGGLDAVTCSVLLGHRDVTMISRHYAHLTQRPDHLRNAVRKARGA